MNLLVVLKLMEIPGVGVRLRDRLVEHYGNEEDALDAILGGDVAGLLSVVKMSERQAVSLAQRARGLKYGVTPADFLVTEEAVRIYRALVEQMAGCAHTDYARLKIGTLFPSSCRDLVEENRALSHSAIESAAALEDSGLGDLLTRVRPLRAKPPTRVRNRVLVVDSAQDFEELRARGLGQLIDLQLVENVRELRDLADGYDRVTSLCRDLDHFAMDDVEEAESQEDWYLLPEVVLGRYVENLDVLEAALEAARMLDRSGVRSFSTEDLKRLIDGIKEEDDEESLRLERLLGYLNSRIDEGVSWANDELKRRVEASSVTLDGTDLLQALGGDVKDLLEARMRDTFQEVLKTAVERVASGLDLKGLERAHLEEIFPSEIEYPFDADRPALIRFGQALRRRLETRKLEARRNLARELADRWDDVQEMVSTLLEFDVYYSLGRFALREGLKMPQFVEEPCIGFEEGRNLFLEDPEPVSYSVGDCGMVDHRERVVLLSGVNSGGKTSTLELVTQMVILAHMGMPVPAAYCRLSFFQELYYFGKSRGTLGAGAFEATICKFSVVANDRRKLVLADELEAITEPGASAKIIASLLDELGRRESGSVAIFVSHLAEDVERYVATPIRIDGIEAEGLDSENNLIVNRNPRYNHRARSTPELIIDRLVRSTTGEDQEFYRRLLKKFR